MVVKVKKRSIELRSLKGFYREDGKYCSCDESIRGKFDVDGRIKRWENGIMTGNMTAD